MGLLALLAVTGCGEGRSAGGEVASAAEERQLDAVMDRFRAAFNAEDGTRGCALLARSMRREMATVAIPGAAPEPAGSCEDGFRRLSTADIMEDLTPTRLAYDIGTKKATVSGWVSHLKERQTAHFVKEDGVWKVATWFN